MTTIAYRDGVLAADTLTTINDGTRYGQAAKIKRVGPVLIGCSGSAAVAESFRDWVAGGMKGNSPYHGSEEGNGLVVAPGGVAVCFGKNGPFRVSGTKFMALGSGTEIALGAMAHGASAPEAVRAAIELDTNSGGDVTVLMVDA